MSGTEIARSWSSSIFSFLSNLHTILHRGCITLYFHHQCKRVPFTPYPLQNLVYGDFVNGPSDWYEVIPHCSSDLHFSNN